VFEAAKRPLTPVYQCLLPRPARETR
jgi:hypothetical protein